MNNEDISEMIQKLSTMINNSNNDNSTNNFDNNDMSSNSNETSFENLQAILSNMNFNSNNNDGNNNYNENDNNNFNLDFETIMKMKRAMDIFNSNKNSPEANLLLSLKPYLNNNRKQKLDQYMQFLNISKVLEVFNNNGGVNNNDISK